MSSLPSCPEPRNIVELARAKTGALGPTDICSTPDKAGFRREKTTRHPFLHRLLCRSTFRSLLVSRWCHLYQCSRSASYQLSDVVNESNVFVGQTIENACNCLVVSLCQTVIQRYPPNFAYHARLHHGTLMHIANQLQ